MYPDLASRKKRLALGRKMRDLTPRESHAQLPEAAGRDPLALLAESDAGRLPELLPVRYERMAASPFAFLRGAATIMAFDLAQAPAAGIPVQACGDCHLMNFGAFGTPEDNILFDINDFDETLPGVDFTVDVKRLAASFAVAADAAGLSARKAVALARKTVAAYREAMLWLSTLTPLEVWHSRIDLEAEVQRFENKALRRRMSALVRKAADTLDLDDNFPHLVEDGRRIADKPPLIYHLDETGDGRHRLDAEAAFAAYRSTLTPDRRVLVDRFALADLAIKVVGVGSVGTFCAVGLFLDGDGVPLFLQVKEAMRSALERIVPAPGLAHQGRRVVEGQRLLQAASDLFLGWSEDQASGRQFYVRQLKNRRLGSVSELVEEESLSDYAGLCGRTLARAHTRSGDPAAIAGYLGKGEAFDEALGEFARAYAKRTKADHAALVASRAGKTEARQL